MKQKAVVSNGIVEDRLVMFQGKRRYAAVVETLNEGTTLGSSSKKPDEQSVGGGHVEAQDEARRQ